MLYSVVVNFKAEDDIYFNYFPGESLHAMFFNLLSKQDKAKAKLLHDDKRVKAFSISPILPYPSFVKGRRKLKAKKKYFFRITFLVDEWYLLFMESFLFQGAKLNLQNKKIEITEVKTVSKSDKRCRFIEYDKLIEMAKKDRKIKFKFHSTTTFRLDEQHLIYPKPEILFYSLKTKWEAFSDYQLELREDDLKKIYISRYDLNSTMEKFNGYMIKGFCGNCEYELSDKLTARKRKDLNLLADFAFYSGVGYKTTMGLGQVVRK